MKYEELAMKKQLSSLTTSRQEGQLLVNLAKALVGVGLVVGAAIQAQVFFQNYQFEAYYDELKDVETALWDYKAETGHWPGDCNVDGVIDIGGQDKVLKSAPASNCAFGVRSQEAMLKVFTDLASADMLDEKLRAKFADNEGQYMQVAHDANSESKGQNVLVAFDIAPELAQWLDKRIDGTLAAGAGRVRLWANGGSLERWPVEAEANSVSIAYYFDTKI